MQSSVEVKSPLQLTAQKISRFKLSQAGKRGCTRLFVS